MRGAERNRPTTPCKVLAAAGVLLVVLLTATDSGATSSPMAAATAAGGPATWVATAGGAGTARASDVAVDAAGSGYVLGVFDGTVTFAGAPGAGGATASLTSRGSGDAFVAKYLAGGQLAWVTRVGGGFSDRPVDLAVTGNGTVVATVTTWGNPIAEGTDRSETVVGAGGSDAVVVSFAADGALRWANRIGGSGFDSAGPVAVDPYGRAHTTGTFGLTAHVGPTPGGVDLTSAGLQDVYAASYAADGSLRWAVRLAAGGNDDSVQGLVSSAGALFVSGGFRSTTEIGGTRLWSADEYHGGGGWVVRLSPVDGSVAWVREWRELPGAPASWLRVWDMTPLPGGDVAVTGQLQGRVRYGVPGQPSEFAVDDDGNPSAFVARLGPGGVVQWLRVSGGTGDAMGLKVAAAADGTIVALGSFTGTAWWWVGALVGERTAASPDGKDAFLAVVDPAGSPIGLLQGGAETDSGLAVAGDGAVWLTGWFSGTTTLPDGQPHTATSASNSFVLRAALG